MTRRFCLAALIVTSLTACRTSAPPPEKAKTEKQTDSSPVIVTDEYELHKASREEAVLVLFPGAGTDAEYTKENFDILPAAMAHDVSVLLMNYNGGLWLDTADRQSLSRQFEQAFAEHDLGSDRIYIGGFSIGGTVALSVGDELIKRGSRRAPRGVFVVDAPIDLYALYQSAETDLARDDLTEERLAEPTYIIDYFTQEFGRGDSLLEKIAAISPFVLETGRTGVPHLRDVKLRFYTEPDTLWWMENRGTDFRHTNAYVIRNITAHLKAKGWDKPELIETKNKGYRANGDRHPHSWSIVDVEGLMDWIVE